MNNIIKGSMAALVLMVVLLPQASYAWEGHGHRGHGHGHGHSFLSVDFGLGHWPYYYHNTYYYAPTDYVLVSPSNFQPVLINGSTYYLNNGVYYLYTGYGYKLVNPPLVVQTVAPAVQVTVGAGAANSEETLVVNIPNVQGGYTAVSIKRSGHGFVGPQGEFYSQFPKVSQLEAMYAK